MLQELSDYSEGQSLDNGILERRDRKGSRRKTNTAWFHLHLEY